MGNQSFLLIDIEHKATGSTPGITFVPDLDYYVLRDEAMKIRVLLKKRNAYPATYCQKTGNNSFELGYGPKNPTPQDEFLHIVYSSGELTIKRDSFATLPIYFAENKRHLVVNNEYREVVEQLPAKELSQQAFLKLLAGDSTAGPLAKEVKPLMEDQSLEWDGKVTTKHAPPRKWATSKDATATDPYSFLDGFNTFLDYFIETRLAGGNFAFEVSGGLDSATLPQYYARKVANGITCASLLLSDKESAATQQPKLSAVQSATKAQFFYTTLNPAIHFPLARMTRTGSLLAPFCTEMTYEEALSDLLSQLKAQGVEIICTGQGGDEFFGNTADATAWMTHGQPERTRRQKAQLPPYTTPAFRQAYVEGTPKQALGNLPKRPPSVTYEQLGNNVYIRHNIWPVSPFSDPDFYTWIQGLPAHFRANRNIIRAYQQAMGFVEEIYNPVQNEAFNNFARGAFYTGSYDALIQALLPNSAAIKYGYVDTQELFAAYDSAKSGMYSPEDADEVFFGILCWIMAEINAQHSGFVRIS